MNVILQKWLLFLLVILLGLWLLSICAINRLGILVQLLLWLLLLIRLHRLVLIVLLFGRFLWLLVNVLEFEDLLFGRHFVFLIVVLFVYTTALISF